MTKSLISRLPRSPARREHLMCVSLSNMRNGPVPSAGHTRTGWTPTPASRSSDLGVRMVLQNSEDHAACFGEPEGGVGPNTGHQGRLPGGGDCCTRTWGQGRPDAAGGERVLGRGVAQTWRRLVCPAKPGGTCPRRARTVVRNVCSGAESWVPVLAPLPCNGCVTLDVILIPANLSFPSVSWGRGW